MHALAHTAGPLIPVVVHEAGSAELCTTGARPVAWGFVLSRLWYRCSQQEVSIKLPGLFSGLGGASEKPWALLLGRDGGSRGRCVFVEFHSCLFL